MTFSSYLKTFWKLAACILVASVFSAASAGADTGFQSWIDSFYKEAHKAGIMQATYEDAFAGVTEPDDEVLRKAQYQPEFTIPIWDYLESRITDKAVITGQLMAIRYAHVLAPIEERFGIPPQIVLAIWSMESGYGMIFDRPGRLHYVPRALATLAYRDAKRAKFARQQLVAALEILQKGDINKNQLMGSWAGAMGHTQFIPTSYLAYGVDMDKNGKIDIWSSVPDALATAANLLHENNWQKGKTWGYEIVAKPNLVAYKGQTKTIAQWEKLGFSRPGNKAFPRPDDRAELKFPGGDNGPPFLMLKNFFVIKRYNNSDFYALAVGQLADRIAGVKGMQQEWPRPPGSLIGNEKYEIQQLLKQHSYYDGAIDGNLGSGTRAAIRAFQRDHGMTVDGIPSQSVLKALRQ